MSSKLIKVWVFYLFVFLVLTAVYQHKALARETIFSETDIKLIVEEHINSNMPWTKENVRIWFLGKIPEVRLPENDTRFLVRGRADEDFIGDTTFVVCFYSKGRLLKETPVRVRIEVGMDIVVSTRHLFRDTDIREGDVKLVRKWFINSPMNLLTDIQDVLGRQLNSDVRQNSEIRRNTLREMRCIKRGKIVRIMLETGMLTITAYGVAQQDGNKGDFIKVKNLSSNKSVYARVEDDSSVRVEL